MICRQLTEYMVTRWYRSPEILCEAPYGAPLDLWAVGCIFAEMIGRTALFCGRDYLHQIRSIVETLGTPSAEELAFISEHSPRAAEYVLALPVKERKPFDEMYPDASSTALDLLARLLAFHPAQRMTAAQAVEHPYFVEHYGASLASTARPPSPIFDDTFELLTGPSLRHALDDELGGDSFPLYALSDAAIAHAPTQIVSPSPTASTVLPDPLPSPPASPAPPPPPPPHDDSRMQPAINYGDLDRSTAAGVCVHNPIARNINVVSRTTLTPQSSLPVADTFAKTASDSTTSWPPPTMKRRGRRGGRKERSKRMKRVGKQPKQEERCQQEIKRQEDLGNDPLSCRMARLLGLGLRVPVDFAGMI